MPDRRSALLAPRQRGVSLVEALVAMAVMAFGMLGVVGMQTTLRTNSDVSKQRAEAVRIAQRSMEDWRAFETLSASAATDYEDIRSGSGLAVAGYDATNTNTTFTRSATVFPDTATLAADAPRLKSVTMTVAWTDRTGATVDVSLTSAIAAVPPELAGSLGLPGDRGPSQAPGGRHPGIPPLAVYNQAIGQFVLTPPGGDTPTYVFDRVHGTITQRCTVAPASVTDPPTGCTSFLGVGLSGFIRFVTGTSTNPTGAQAENPTDPAFIPSPLPAFGAAVVDLTLPASPAFGPECFLPPAWSTSVYIGYFCAVPTETVAPFRWSGKLVLTLPAPVSPATTPVISATLADINAANYKVCRYTPVSSNATTVANVDHPFVYTNVTTPLWNQNFLVISAGNGSTAFACPGDDTSTPLINGNTYRHQPDS